MKSTHALLLIMSEVVSHNFWFLSLQSFSILALFSHLLLRSCNNLGRLLSFLQLHVMLPSLHCRGESLDSNSNTNNCHFQIPVNKKIRRKPKGEGASSHQRSWLTWCLWELERLRCRWELTLEVWEWPRAVGSAERWWLELVTVLLLVSALEGW